MRTYAEEKRSGTIELLLTSPLTDFQIVLGKFLGAMGLYRRHARGHAARTSACCSASATPSGSRSRPAISGCFLMGGCFVSVGPVHLEPDHATRSSPAW